MSLDEVREQFLLQQKSLKKTLI